MHKFLTLVVIAVTSLALVVPENADARRFGGARSLGKQRPSFSRQAAPPSRPASPTRNAAGAAPQRSGMSRWLGPLAGLAAGGLLASMLFGDGFQGIQFFDILIIAALIFGGFWLFKRMRSKPAPAGHHYAAAGPGNFRTPDIGSGLGGGGAAAPQGDTNRPPPSWFNGNSFLTAAKKQFVGLQKAWDTGNMEEIRETTTPELYAELVRERQALGEGRQYTEVVSLKAEPAGYEYEGNNFIVSVQFTGLIKEDPNGQPQPVREIWHIQRAVDDPDANWYVAGIQQV